MAAQPTDDVARTLAAQSSEWFAPKGAVQVRCANRSRAKESEFSPLCRAFTRELQRLGLATGSGDQAIEFTASEGAGGRLLVASVDSSRTAVVQWTTAPQDKAPSGRIRVERAVLLESLVAVLDGAELRGGDALAVLESTAVAVYLKTTTGWELSRRELLPLTRPLPRDARGKLSLTPTGAATVYLPIGTCMSEDIFTKPFTCTTQLARWSLAPGVTAAWAANRNYLDAEAGTVYTVAAVSADRFLAASTDGSMRLIGVRGEQAASTTGLGSDVTSVDTACGTMAVGTRADPASETDQLIAVDVRNGRIETAGSGLPLPGPVTALWSTSKSTEAVGVVRNAITGAYEVSRVAIACLQ